VIRPALAAVLAATLALAGCGDDDADDAAPDETTPTAPATTEPLEFDGDPDSAFCRRSREAAERPVLDPFEAGLEPQEVELRFRALTQRFDGFAELAPPELEDDLALLDERFDELARVLDEADYDFAQVAASGVDLSVFDDPELGAVADRLSAYQAQVCTLDG
jgi:hypothetical protein